MPIYEYRCESCGHDVEAMQKLSDAALTDCPACHKPALKKRISAAGFQLKGSGWYATDFKGGKKSSEKSEKGESASDSDAKPAGGCGTGCGCH